MIPASAQRLVIAWSTSRCWIPRRPGKGNRLVCEDRPCGLFADQSVQCVDVLTACARLGFARHDHTNAGAGKILDALNAERIAGRDQ